MFEERLKLDGGSHTDIPTRAAATLTELLRDPSCRVVVLTGDAGHGKTHLCRVILERLYGCPGERAMESLRGDRLGHFVHTAAEHPGMRPLRILPDLSEIDDDSALTALRDLVGDDSSIALICANEGRLRYVVSKSSDAGLGAIVHALEEGTRRGVTTLDGAVHVINMNFQSVTAPVGAFVGGILSDWAADGRRWTTCKNCEASPRCPIFRNRNFLGAPDDPAARRRREGIEQLLRIVERAGQVLTIRDTLSLCAYAITGALDCAAVAELDKKKGLRDSGRYEFEQILFDQPKSDVVDRRLPVLAQLRRCDPGLQAIRELDEALARQLDESSLLGDDRKRRYAQPPRTVKEAKTSAKQHRQRMRRARRVDFFELDCELRRSLLSPGEGVESVSKDEFSRARRLGFRHYGDFAMILGGGRGDAGMLGIRDRVIQGLHVVQGIRPRSDTHLLLTDPAFARAGSRAPVVARQIAARRVRLKALEATWDTPELTTAIDWLPRVVVVDFDGEAGVELDLQQFEFLLRAAGGITFREFHAPAIRRMLRQLARLTSTASKDDEIRVVDGANIRNVMVDHGTFKVSDA